MLGWSNTPAHGRRTASSVVMFPSWSSKVSSCKLHVDVSVTYPAACKAGLAPGCLQSRTWGLIGTVLARHFAHCPHLTFYIALWNASSTTFDVWMSMIFIMTSTFAPRFFFFLRGRWRVLVYSMRLRLSSLGGRRGGKARKFLLDIFHNRLTGFVLFLRGYCSVKIKSLSPEVSLTELSLLQVQDPASFIKLFMRKHVQCRSRRCVLDLLHSLLRKTFLRDVLEVLVHAQFVQRCCAAVHAQICLARQRSVPDGLGCARATQTRPREKIRPQSQEQEFSRCARQLPQEQVSHVRSQVQVQVPRTRFLKKALHR